METAKLSSDVLESPEVSSGIRKVEFGIRHGRMLVNVKTSEGNNRVEW